MVSAFDSVSHNDSRRAVYEAGVTGKLWLLIDDLLSADTASINVNGVSSAPFQLGGGTVQGRKISAHLFNCVMKYLNNLIVLASDGVSAPSRLGGGLETRIVDLQYSDDLAAPASSRHNCVVWPMHAIVSVTYIVQHLTSAQVKLQLSDLLRNTLYRTLAAPYHSSARIRIWGC